jgi:kynurenine formamidase
MLRRNSEWDDAGFKLLRISYAEHVATHSDAPLHFSEDGESVDEISHRQAGLRLL